MEDDWIIISGRVYKLRPLGKGCMFYSCLYVAGFQEIKKGLLQGLSRY